MKIYGVENPWEQILIVTIAIFIIFIVWYCIAKSKNNQKQMQRSLETCLGIYFVYLFGIFGVIIVGIYLLFVYIGKSHKNSTTPSENLQQTQIDKTKEIDTPKINVFGEQTISTPNEQNNQDKDESDNKSNEPFNEIDIYKM